MFRWLGSKDVTETIQLNAEQQAQAYFVVDYVNSLKFYFLQIIKQVNDNEHGIENLRLPEHVLKSFIWAPLFNPLNTFGVDFNFDADDPDADFETLRLYIALQNIFTDIRLNENHVPPVNFVKPLFVHFSAEALERVFAQMRAFLEVVQKHYVDIYVNAVGFYYGIDTEAAVIAYQDLVPDYPYIIFSKRARPSGELFANLMASACESYFAPKLYS